MSTSVSIHEHCEQPAVIFAILPARIQGLPRAQETRTKVLSHRTLILEVWGQGEVCVQGEASEAGRGLGSKVCSV